MDSLSNDDMFRLQILKNSNVQNINKIDIGVYKVMRLNKPRAMEHNIQHIQSLDGLRRIQVYYYQRYDKIFIEPYDLLFE